MWTRTSELDIADKTDDVVRRGFATVKEEYDAERLRKRAVDRLEHAERVAKVEIIKVGDEGHIVLNLSPSDYPEARRKSLSKLLDLLMVERGEAVASVKAHEDAIEQVARHLGAAAPIEKRRAAHRRMIDEALKEHSTLKAFDTAKAPHAVKVLISTRLTMIEQDLTEWQRSLDALPKGEESHG